VTIPLRRWLLAIAVVVYLYFLLPVSAVMFYELYHLTKIDPVYWGYSIFKAAGYYFSTWEYRVHSLVAVAVAILLLPLLFEKLRGK
tara:strand:+ start:5387 stop:5644 length:258 start_codon:yes stop_codon:yes gene_type:complete